jgi:hypothetical protein
VLYFALARREPATVPDKPLSAAGQA